MTRREYRRMKFLERYESELTEIELRELRFLRWKMEEVKTKE